MFNVASNCVLNTPVKITLCVCELLCWVFRRSEIDIHPCIFQSNRQIYIKAIDVLYGQNFFYINPVTGLEASGSTESYLACYTQDRACLLYTSDAADE